MINFRQNIHQINPNPMNTIERLASHTDLDRLSRSWWFCIWLFGKTGFSVPPGPPRSPSHPAENHDFPRRPFFCRIIHRLARNPNPKPMGPPSVKIPMALLKATIGSSWEPRRPQMPPKDSTKILDTFCPNKLCKINLRIWGVAKVSGTQKTSKTTAREHP
jgi:hypothetical protein